MRKGLMVLLGMGVVFGYGSAFARLAHHRHGECHGGGWEGRWRGERGEGPDSRFEVPAAAPAPVAAPVAVPQTVVVPQAPAAPAAPAPLIVVVPVNGAAAPQPQMVVVPQAAAAPQTLVLPQAAPQTVVVPQAPAAK